MKKNLILCKSVHHHNTWKVAEAMARVLDAEIVSPEEFPYTSLDDHDIVGFGSGIYYGGVHPDLMEWVRGLPSAPLGSRKAFVFSTSGLPFLWRLWHRPLMAELYRKGFTVMGEFHCPGFDTWGPLWLTGGIHRSHPDSHDLERAIGFAHNILRQASPERAFKVAG